MPYFLQHFAKNWVKSLVHGTLHEKFVLLRSREVLVVFHQMPYFLQHFAKNWVKSLVHGTFHKKLLVLKRSAIFGGFSPNPSFCKILLKIGSKPKCTVLCTRSC